MFSDEVLKQFEQGRRFPACGAHGHPSLHFDVPTFQCSTTSVPAMRCASAGSSPGAQSAAIRALATYEWREFLRWRELHYSAPCLAERRPDPSSCESAASV